MTSVVMFIIGVLFGSFGGKICGDSWFAGWLNHLPGPSISPKRIPIRIIWMNQSMHYSIILSLFHPFFHRSVVIFPFLVVCNTAFWPMKGECFVKVMFSMGNILYSKDASLVSSVDPEISGFVEPRPGLIMFYISPVEFKGNLLLLLFLTSILFAGCLGVRHLSLVILCGLT